MEKKMKAQEIYNILRAGGLTRAGALGMLGNMMAESSLKENIVQRGMTSLSDEEYTRQADAGLLDFSRPIGYGLVQWTFPARKKSLMSYAKSYGVSVGDGAMQVDFCLLELREDYPAVFKQLCESTSIDGCSDLVCTQYERPAVNNLLTRRNFAYQFEKEISDKLNYNVPVKDPVQATFPPDPSIKMLQYVMADNDYWEYEQINGYKSKEFFAKLKEFVSDIEKC